MVYVDDDNSPNPLLKFSFSGLAAQAIQHWGISLPLTEHLDTAPGQNFPATLIRISEMQL